MTNLKSLALLSLFGLLLCGAAHAENNVPPVAARTDAQQQPVPMQNITTEQMKAIIEDHQKIMKAKLDAMTPEERKAFEKNMQERREKWMKEHPQFATPPTGSAPQKADQH